MSRKSYTKKMAAREEKKKQEIEAKGKPRKGGGPAFSGDWYMLFGDYEGCWISSLPDEYVKMVLRTVNPEKYPEIVHAAKLTLKHREKAEEIREHRGKCEQLPRKVGGPHGRYDAKMSFGTYKDCWISSLSISYLIWITENLDVDKYPDIVRAANSYCGEHLLHPKRWKSMPKRAYGSFGGGSKG